LNISGFIEIVTWNDWKFTARAKKTELTKYSQPQSTSELILSTQEPSDLVIIKDNLAERIKSAKTPEEVGEYLKYRKDVQDVQNSETKRVIEEKSAMVKIEATKMATDLTRKKEENKMLMTNLMGIVALLFGLALTVLKPDLANAGILIVIIVVAQFLGIPLAKLSKYIKGFD